MTSAVTGAFDKELFTKYRNSKGKERRALEGTLILQNTPLVKLLVAQYRGEDNSPPRRGFTKAKREPGIESLEWEECYAAGMTGMLKAVRGLNLEKGGFTKYTAWKIRHELQGAITKAQVVSVPKGSDRADRPKGFDFFEDEEGMQRALLTKREAEEGLDDGLDEDGKPKALVRPKSAIADFIERRCQFRPIFVTMREVMFCAYETHARMLDFPVATHMLEEALEAKGVVAMKGKTTGGRVGRFFRRVSVISLQELSRRVTVAADA